eukprot:44201-Prymnesium_polylepis.2
MITASLSCNLTNRGALVSCDMCDCELQVVLATACGTYSVQRQRAPPLAVPIHTALPPPKQYTARPQARRPLSLLLRRDA